MLASLVESVCPIVMFLHEIYTKQVGKNDGPIFLDALTRVGIAPGFAHRCAIHRFQSLIHCKHLCKFLHQLVLHQLAVSFWWLIFVSHYWNQLLGKFFNISQFALGWGQSGVKIGSAANNEIEWMKILKILKSISCFYQSKYASSPDNSNYES